MRWNSYLWMMLGLAHQSTVELKSRKGGKVEKVGKAGKGGKRWKSRIWLCN